jgi:hypothetical protein
LLHFHRQDLDIGHLLVEELHESAQLSGSLIGNEDQTDFALLEIRFHTPPERVQVHVRSPSKQVRDLLIE